MITNQRMFDLIYELLKFIASPGAKTVRLAVKELVAP